MPLETFINFPLKTEREREKDKEDREGEGEGERPLTPTWPVKNYT